MEGTGASESSGNLSRASSESSLCKLSDSELGAVGGEPKMATAGEDSPIAKLLEKQRREIMFELRRLKMGDRPVTGQENKKNVEEFFNSRLNPSEESTSTEQHRPEAVLVEVQGLVQTRPVSSILQSTQFRRTLENAIRGGFASLSTRAPPAAPRPEQPSQPASAPPPPPAPPLHEETLERIRQGVRPQPQPLPPLPVHPTQPSGATARRPVESVNRGAAAAAPAAVPEVPSYVRAQAWLQQVPHVDAREQVRMSVWENIEQAQRESVIMDISELVQAQLVTQTLEGEFRNTLEARMMDHLASSGTDGRRVQEFLQSLPPAPHLRNDFSDLGIQAPNVLQAGAGSDAMDNISVISATAAVQVQQTQQQALMSREMRAVKAQLQEMKEMLRMSFDMQLDLQRAIRQEVAAALAANQGPTAALPPPRSAQPVDDTQCLICLDSTADTVLYQCGHLCLCFTCGVQLQNRAASCPVCRAPIRDIMRVYKAGHTRDA